MKQANQGPAALIRADLKSELGLTARQVSVRTSRGSAVNIEIKDPTADFAQIEAIASRQEVIHRDGFGEILGGGNTFVFVHWSTEARTERASRHLSSATKAIAELEAAGRDSNILIPIVDKGAENGPEVLIGWDQPGFGYRVWNGNTAGMHVNTAECAAAITADYIDEQTAKEVA